MWWALRLAKWAELLVSNKPDHGLRTPNEGIIQRNLVFWADVADKICFGRTYKFGIWIWFSAVQGRGFPHQASVVREPDQTLRSPAGEEWPIFSLNICSLQGLHFCKCKCLSLLPVIFLSNSKHLFIKETQWQKISDRHWQAFKYCALSLLFLP